MMGIADKLLHSTVRIDCLNNNGQSSFGTGFFYNVKSESNAIFPVIVTNKHVVHGQSRGFIHLTFANEAGEPVHSTSERIELLDFPSVWIDHPDNEIDLAICMFGPVANHFHRLGKHPVFCPLNERMIPDSTQFADLDAIEEITMIGYPDGLWDSKNNRPIVRRGITATPAFGDYEGRREFIIDAACFPGSSGSPVLLLNRGFISKRNGSICVGQGRVLLLGILYAGPQITASGKIVVPVVPTSAQRIAVINLMMNLGFCIRSSTLLDFEPVLRARGFMPAAQEALSNSAA